MKISNLAKIFRRRNAAPADFVAGEALGALQAEVEAGRPCVLPLVSVVVPKPEYAEAWRIAASIRDFPEDWGWARKGYDLIHIPSGFKLWVANQDYGLAEVHPNNGKTDFPKPEQEIIWPAVAEWLGHRKIGFTGRPLRPRLHRKDGAFWCQSPAHPWVGVGHTAEDAYQSWLAAVSAKARGELDGGRYIVVQRWKG
ncbi:hypothetical protein F0170_11230 [Pseudomonas sp. MAFF 730085]|uniref:Uncharacterized protein n=1 Tax=Pseudomonas kitaguniensis TaxID=2607908 RepID=A0A5N7JSY1_9PSED|nr:hypothetical protein [Pseudomonas kitaguniensis]MPQ84508.1 hypothetical protein [Pseudomonas kitaguniensis]